MVIGTKVYFFLFRSPSLSRPSSAITIPLLPLHAFAICMMVMSCLVCVLRLPWLYGAGLMGYCSIIISIILRTIMLLNRIGSSRMMSFSEGQRVMMRMMCTFFFFLLFV